jgi:hypothetical protein
MKANTLLRAMIGIRNCHLFHRSSLDHLIQVVSEVAMANADVLGNSDDYNSIVDGSASDISPEAIKEAILQT